MPHEIQSKSQRTVVHPRTFSGLKDVLVEMLKNDQQLQTQVPAIVSSNNSDVSSSAKDIIDVMYQGVLKELGQRLGALEKQTVALEKKTEDLERYNRTWCLRFYGLKESQRENTTAKVIQFINTELQLKLSMDEIENSHRIRHENNKPTSQQNNDDKCHAVIVRFYSRSVRQSVLASLVKLKGKIWVLQSLRI
ncbi:unnamed protein product [Didymodactylos carnosus]|uniref:Uncharacterized protein n=1 Tax=Didymodactylos carnosus TaxID=1234261 RepID=A0A8S2RJV1_9BILA|nr:unnamed protein product [Didymodactylos carnosus]CAF4166793.1 unnamed protein product [Didymodactylos carnosus]